MRRAAGARPERAAVAAVFALLLAFGLWNAARYPPGRGYDAQHHFEYADLLIHQGKLPSRQAGRSEADTPPLYYALAGSATWAGERIGLGEPRRVALALDLVFTLAAAAAVLAIARLVIPERPWAQVAALAYFALLPVVVKTTAMFHPETLNAALAAVALLLAVRMLARRAFGWPPALLLGLALGLEQLVRKSAVLVFAAVFLSLAGALLVRYAPRLELARALAVVTALTVAFALPWQIYLRTEPAAPNRPNTGPPLHLVGSFFYGIGLPAVIARPYRPEYVNRALPMTYTDVWGDYFGAWSWTPPPPPARGEHRRLTAQSVVGILPTALAIVGWLALLAWALARPRTRAPLLPLVLLPGIVLAGFLWSTSHDLSPDGDVIKATYILVSAPAWAVAFGFALSRLPRRVALPLAALLVLAALVDLPFLVYGGIL